MPFVISSTAHTMFTDDANAVAKLPCPVPLIMVAPYVSPNGVNIFYSLTWISYLEFDQYRYLYRYRYRYQVPIPGIGIGMNNIGMNPVSVIGSVWEYLEYR